MALSREARRRSQVERTVNRSGNHKGIEIGRESSSYDPSTGENNTTTTWYAVNSIPPSNFEYRLIDDSLIRTGDLVLGVPAQGLSIAPNTSDKVRLDSETWQIVQVRPRWSGEQVALYEMQVRR